MKISPPQRHKPPLHRSLATVAVTLLAVIGSTASMAAPLKPFKAEYTVARNGSTLGSGTIALVEHRDKTWEFSTHSVGDKGLAGLVGVEINESSTFVWENDQPRLRDYRFKQDAAWKHKSKSIHLDGESGSVTSTFDERSIDLGAHPEALDRNLASVAVMRAIANNETVIHVPIVEKDQLDSHEYRVSKTETIDVPAGSFNTIRVERIRTTPGRTTTSWFAPKLGYLPVKIEQREKDGETITMVLKRVPQ